MLDTTTGEVVRMTLKHEGNNVREFYPNFHGQCVWESNVAPYGVLSTYEEFSAEQKDSMNYPEEWLMFPLFLASRVNSLSVGNSPKRSTADFG